jgi:hypothetical protein
MEPQLVPAPGFASILVQVRPDSPDRYTAQVVGYPALQATATTRDEALAQLRAHLSDRLAAGELVPLAIPSRLPARKPTGWAEDDALEEEFLGDLARLRQEDLDRTLREDERDDHGCSGTSSTPTT